MADTSDIPNDPHPTALSASLWSQGKIAARGIASLFRASPSGNPGGAIDADVISEDTLRPKRIPPGQHETKKWPVLHAGTTPKVDLATWTLSFSGLVASPLTFSWPEFRTLQSHRVFADMHCVTRWSMLNNTWEGVLVSEVLKRLSLRPEARFVRVVAEHGFTTNLPLSDFLSEDCLFAWSHNGKELDPDHGWPLRLVVPKLYAWKSAKWVRGVEFLEVDAPGFWEENGYHNHGDPWTQERFW